MLFAQGIENIASNRNAVGCYLLIDLYFEPAVKLCDPNLEQIIGAGARSFVHHKNIGVFPGEKAYRYRVTGAILEYSATVGVFCDKRTNHCFFCAALAAQVKAVYRRN